MSDQQDNVWTVFVGENGDQLEVFNSKKGPFPPDPCVDGYVAIGWPAVGDMRLYENNYADYVGKFRKVYPNDDERVFKTKANMVWNFAFSIKENDFVICPSSATGYMLVGKIVGGYSADFHNECELYGFKKWPDLVHLRKVQWLYIVPDKDPRYSKLNRLGQLTVSRPDISVDDLKAILDGSKSA